MVTATASSFQRAITRAQHRGGLKAVRELGHGVYSVLGTTGTAYTVRDQAGELVCSCVAAQHETACWHLASVWLLKVARAAVRPVPIRPTCESSEQQRARLKEEVSSHVRRWLDDAAEQESLYSDGAA